MAMTCIPHSPLHMAAKNGDADKIRVLAKSGNVNSHVKCNGIPHPVSTSAGAPPEAAHLQWDRSSLTPLHVAVVYKQSGAISTLIEFGAKVNAPDGKGRTPLDWADAMGHGNAAELLRKNGAKPGPPSG